MKQVEYSKIHIDTPTVLTIGTFDGVHIGHQNIIKKVVGIAQKRNLKALVLTFFPHPRMVLQSDKDIKLINTIEEKADFLSAMGVEHLVVKKFTKDFSRVKATEFVRDVLVNKLKVKHVIVGYDHRFGRNRTATIDDLIELGAFYGFEVTQISAQEIGEVAISSTKIRKALNEGDIETANIYLGYPFLITGMVVEGEKRGRTMGFPTANLAVSESYKLIPKNGVYVIKSNSIDGQAYFGMMNIGHNPTFHTKTAQKLEIHFFNFDQNLYGKTLKIELLARLRDEQKFDSAEVLKEQLEKDKTASLEYLKQKTIDVSSL